MAQAGFTLDQQFRLPGVGVVTWWKCQRCGSSRPEYRLRWLGWKCPDCPRRAG